MRNVETRRRSAVAVLFESWDEALSDLVEPLPYRGRGRLATYALCAISTAIAVGSAVVLARTINYLPSAITSEAITHSIVGLFGGSVLGGTCAALSLKTFLHASTH